MALSRETIIRAWKDATYRASLSTAEKTLLIPHPAGYIELSPEEMDQVAGGIPPIGISRKDCPNPNRSEA